MLVGMGCKVNCLVGVILLEMVNIWMIGMDVGSILP
jgi:hypothetical protein